MNMLAFEATRFVRPALLPVVACFSIIAILLMTMPRPAHAAAFVPPSPPPANLETVFPGELEHYYSSTVSGTAYTLPILAIEIQSVMFNQVCWKAQTGSYTTTPTKLLGGVYTSKNADNSGCQYTHGIYYHHSTYSCPNHSGVYPNCVCYAGYLASADKKTCIEAPHDDTISLETSPADKVAPSGQATVTATVKDAQGNGKSGVAVRLKVEVEANSGGHDHHDAQRPKGTLETGGVTWADTASGTTGASGAVSFIFGAPSVSGTHTFTATCVNPACTNEGTAKIDVKVGDPAGGDLTPIPASQSYALQDLQGNVIGAITGKHSSNHFLTKAAIKKLEDFAKEYKKTINPGAKLYLNDASLKWGGLLDVGSTPWTSPHAGHRRGAGLDIRAANSGPNNEGAVPSAKFDKLSKKAAKQKVKAALHCTENGVSRIGVPCNGIPNNRHFHVDF